MGRDGEPLRQRMLCTQEGMNVEGHRGDKLCKLAVFGPPIPSLNQIFKLLLVVLLPSALVSTCFNIPVSLFLSCLAGISRCGWGLVHVESRPFMIGSLGTLFFIGHHSCILSVLCGSDLSPSS